MPNSEIKIHEHGDVTFVGPDAVRLFQAMTLVSLLKLYAKIHMVPIRGMTVTKMMALASTFSGKPYKRGQASIAAADVQVWIDTMKAAIPINLPDERL